MEIQHIKSAGVKLIGRLKFVIIRSVVLKAMNSLDPFF